MTHSMETRLALAERDIQHLARMTGSHEAHLTAHDERIRKIGSRTGQNADAIAAHARLHTKIEHMMISHTASEARSKERRAMVQWLAAAAVPLISLALIVAGAAGKIDRATVDQVLPQIGKLGK